MWGVGELEPGSSFRLPRLRLSGSGMRREISLALILWAGGGRVVPVLHAACALRRSPGLKSTLAWSYDGQGWDGAARCLCAVPCANTDPNGAPAASWPVPAAAGGLCPCSVDGLGVEGLPGGQGGEMTGPERGRELSIAAPSAALLGVGRMHDTWHPPLQAQGGGQGLGVWPQRWDCFCWQWDEPHGRGAWLPQGCREPGAVSSPSPM